MEERPELIPDLQQDYEAFHVLSSSRPIGMGVMPIPLSEIEAYMRIYCMTDIHDRLFFLKRIRLIDHLYMKWQEDKQKSKETKK